MRKKLSLLMFALFAIGAFAKSLPDAEYGTFWTFEDAEKWPAEITASMVVDNLQLRAGEGSTKNVSFDANNKSIDGIKFTRRLKLNGTGDTYYRCLHFMVAPNSKITVYGMSASSSATRTLNIAVGAFANVVKEFVNDGKAIGKETYTYLGEHSGEIYIYSANSGFNIYGIKVDKPDPKDVSVSASAGEDIAEVVAGEAAGIPIKNLYLKLGPEKYKISKTLEVCGNVEIDGNGAEIDASALTAPLITINTESVSTVAMKDENTESAYKLVDYVKAYNFTVTGLSNSILSNSGKLVYKNIIFENCNIEIVGNNNVFALGTGYPVDLKILNSTIWSKAGHKGFFFKADGKPADVGGDYATTTWTVDHSNLYQIAVTKKANNSNGGIKGKNTTRMVLTNSILDNFGSNAGNEVNGWCWGQNGGCIVEYGNNCYVKEGEFVETWITKGNGDTSGTHISAAPTYVDASNGDFHAEIKTFETAPASIGDPRWSTTIKQLKVLWSSATPTTVAWKPDVSLDAGDPMLANLKVGDVLHVAVSGVTPTPSDEWSAQVSLRDGRWIDLEAGYPVGKGDKTEATFVITGDMLKMIQNYGLLVTGVGFSTSLVYNEPGVYTGSENSIWVGNTASWVQISPAHINKHVPDYNGVKVGDIIRATFSSPCWTEMQYSNMSWNWTPFGDGIEVKNDWTNPVVDFVVKTEAAADIINNNCQAIIVKHSGTLTQVELIPNTDIDIAPASGADLSAAIAAAGIPAPKNVTITLAAGGFYTITNPIQAGGNVIINGNGATIDASGLNDAMIKMNTKSDSEWETIDDININNVTIKGLSKTLFFSGYKNRAIKNFTIDNSVIEIAANNTAIDFTKGSVALNINITNSTIYAPNATSKAFYSSQNGQKATEYDANAIQKFTITNSTMYNLTKGANFFSHRQSNQTWLSYDVKNNIFVNCGKSGQVIRGMNGGQNGKNPTWAIDGNIFNFDGADTSANESTGDSNEPITNSIEATVEFADANNGNFDAFITVVGPAVTSIGDPRWTISSKGFAVLWTADKPVAMDWSDAVVVTPEQLADVKVGDVLHIKLTSPKADGKVYFKTADWQMDLEEFITLKGTEKEVTLVVTGDILKYAQEKGLMITGEGFTAPQIFNEVQLYPGTENSIWLGNFATNGLIDINNIHFINANVKAGDIIRVTAQTIVGADTWMQLYTYNWPTKSVVPTATTPAEVTFEPAAYEFTVTDDMIIDLTEKDQITQIYVGGYTVTQVELIQQGAATAVNGIKSADSEDAPAYNMAGERVNKSYKGIVIKNGKKVVVK